MITLPEPYRALKKYPGYFWNVDDGRLYSIKGSGVLTPLKRHIANHFNKIPNGMPFYEMSVKGVRKRVTVERIVAKALKDHIIPERGSK